MGNDIQVKKPSPLDGYDHERVQRQLRLYSRAQAIVDEAINNPDTTLAWPAPISAALNACTAKQRRFAVLRANGMALSDCYLKVYDVSKDRAEEDVLSDAFSVAKNLKVATSISLIREWLDQRWLLESADARDWALSKLHEEAMYANKASDRIKATELILRAHGGLLDRKEVIHRDGGSIETAKAALDSIVEIMGLDKAIDVSYQCVETPWQGVTHCPHCGGAIGDDAARSVDPNTSNQTPGSA